MSTQRIADDRDAMATANVYSLIARLWLREIDAEWIERLNEPELGLMVFKTQGDPERLLSHEVLLMQNVDRVFDNVVRKIICLAVNLAAASAATGHPHRKATWMMIPAIVLF